MDGGVLDCVSSATQECDAPSVPRPAPYNNAYTNRGSSRNAKFRVWDELNRGINQSNFKCRPILLGLFPWLIRCYLAKCPEWGTPPPPLTITRIVTAAHLKQGNSEFGMSSAKDLIEAILRTDLFCVDSRPGLITLLLNQWSEGRGVLHTHPPSSYYNAYTNWGSSKTPKFRVRASSTKDRIKEILWAALKLIVLFSWLNNDVFIQWPPLTITRIQTATHPKRRNSAFAASSKGLNRSNFKGRLKIDWVVSPVN